MFGLSNFIITEFLLIFYSLVTNVLYSYNNPFLCNNIIHTKNKATPNKRCRRLKPYRIFLCTIHITHWNSIRQHCICKDNVNQAKILFNFFFILCSYFFAWLFYFLFIFCFSATFSLISFAAPTDFPLTLSVTNYKESPLIFMLSLFFYKGFYFKQIFSCFRCITNLMIHS